MEEQSEPNFEQVPNQEPLHVHETFVPIVQASNPLLIGVELVT